MLQDSVSLTFLALSILCCLQVTVTTGSAVEKRYVTIQYNGTKSGMEIAGGTIYYLVSWAQWLSRNESLEKCACMGGELAPISYGSDGGRSSELYALSESLKRRDLKAIDNISAKFWVNKKFAESGLNQNSQNHAHDNGEYCRALESDWTILHGRKSLWSMAEIVVITDIIYVSSTILSLLSTIWVGFWMELMRLAPPWQMRQQLQAKNLAVLLNLCQPRPSHLLLLFPSWSSVKCNFMSSPSQAFSSLLTY